MGNSTKVTIRVSAEFEVINGFGGLQRDIVLRLCLLLPLRKTRVVVGMSRENYRWKKHRYFTEGRLKLLIAPRTAPRNVEYVSENVTYKDPRSGDIYRTRDLSYVSRKSVLFSAENVTVRIFREIVERKIYNVVFGTSGGIAFGIAMNMLFPSLYLQDFLFKNGTCGYSTTNGDIGIGTTKGSYAHRELLDCRHIRLELNTCIPDRTLHVFLNGRQLEFEFLHIPTHRGVCFVFGMQEQFRGLSHEAKIPEHSRVDVVSVHTTTTATAVRRRYTIEGEQELIQFKWKMETEGGVGV